MFRRGRLFGSRPQQQFSTLFTRSSMGCAKRYTATSSEAGTSVKAKQEAQKKAGMLIGTLVFPVTVWLMMRDVVVEPGTDPKYHKQRTLTKEDEENIARSRAEQIAGHNLGGPFELTNAKTKKLMTNTDVFDEHWSLLYFGFSKCAEVCPTSMKFLTDVVHRADQRLVNVHKTNLEKLQIVFVSVDHIRDDPKTLHNWLAKYPRTLGLCGTKEQISKAAQAWRIYFSSADETEEEAKHRETAGVAAPHMKDDTYQLDHSSAVYLVGPDGRVRDFFFRELGVEPTVERIAMHFDDVYGLN